MLSLGLFLVWMVVASVCLGLLYHESMGSSEWKQNPRESFTGIPWRKLWEPEARMALAAASLTLLIVCLR